MAARLLALGADLEAGDRMGRTALHLAAWRGLSLEVTDLLIARGAALEAVDRVGRTPLHLALSRGRSVATVRLLIAEGAPLELRSGYGRRPLHAAARAPGGAELVEALLAADASLEGRDRLGRSALHAAAQGSAGRRRGRCGRCSLRGARVDARDGRGLDGAALRGALRAQSRGGVRAARSRREAHCAHARARDGCGRSLSATRRSATPTRGSGCSRGATPGRPGAERRCTPGSPRSVRSARRSRTTCATRGFAAPAEATAGGARALLRPPARRAPALERVVRARCGGARSHRAGGRERLRAGAARAGAGHRRRAAAQPRRGAGAPHGLGPDALLP